MSSLMFQQQMTKKPSPPIGVRRDPSASLYGSQKKANSLYGKIKPKAKPEPEPEPKTPDHSNTKIIIYCIIAILFFTSVFIGYKMLS